MKADQERVAKLLNDTVTLLCKNGLIYKNNLTVQGLLGITLDKNEVFIVHINESIGASVTVDANQKQKQTLPPASNVVDLTKIADPPITPSHQHQQSTMRYHNTVSSPVLGQARKQRPQMINQTMLLQRNELLQQVQNRLRMNTSMMPQAMGPMPVPIAPMPMYQPRQPILRPTNHRQRPIINPRRPSSLQQNQAPISLLDEDDVVIVGTGREDPHSSPRRSQGARIGRNPQPSKNFRMHSNESQPIVIPQDCAPFHDANLGMGMSYPPHRMQMMEGLHGLNPGFVEPKNFLGEIVIEPTNSADVDITSMLGFPQSSQRMEDCQMEVGSSHGAEVHVDRRKPEENSLQDRVTVYLDVAEDGVQNDFKPCYGNVEVQQKGQQSKVDDTSREFRKVGEETINLDSLGLHMLTEGEDDPHSSVSSWQCKVPTCQAFYAESSQLASHYIHEHTQQLDLSIKDSAGSEMPQQSEITADSSCVEARQDPSRAETVEAQTTCPMMSESNEGHEEVPGSIGHSSDNSSHSESRLSNSPCLKASRPMWMERSSIDQTEVKTHPTDGLDSIQEALNLPTGGAFSEMSPIVQPQGQAHEAATLANARDDASYLGRDVLSPSMDPGATLDHLSIPVSPQNRTLQIVPDHLRPACFHETADFRDGEAMFSGDHREVEMDFNQMECDPTRTFDEEERADNSSRSPCLTIDNVELEHDNL